VLAPKAMKQLGAGTGMRRGYEHETGMRQGKVLAPKAMKQLGAGTGMRRA
jgi:hypothetical protein